MIQLTKEQTLLGFYKSNKILQNLNRFNFTSKIKSRCLKCGTTIYISYFNNNMSSIFCDLHKQYAEQENIIQLQYFRIQKEQALKTIEND